MEKKSIFKLTTKHVVAIGIGAALYAAASMISINVAPNTSLRLAVALLCIFGAIFGPVVGFLVGFIGHALNDAISYGSVWWSWVFMSGSIGLCTGFIVMKADFDVLKGQITTVHIGLLYVYALFGAVLGSVLSYVGDVCVYGEPAEKVWLQIIVANITNLIVVAVIGIPVVVAIATLKGRTTDLEEE